MQSREEKQKEVEEFRAKIKRAEAAFLTEYQGIKVKGITFLRKTLRESGVEFKVMKNTLLGLSIKDTEFSSLSEHLNGPMAVALSYKDASSAAKTLTKFAKDEPNFKIKIGVLKGKLLNISDIKMLSELPSKEELLAKLLGTLKNPQAGLVSVLSGVPRKFLYALNAVKHAKEASI